MHTRNHICGMSWRGTTQAQNGRRKRKRLKSKSHKLRYIHGRRGGKRWLFFSQFPESYPKVAVIFFPTLKIEIRQAFYLNRICLLILFFWLYVVSSSDFFDVTAQCGIRYLGKYWTHVLHSIVSEFFFPRAHSINDVYTTLSIYLFFFWDGNHWKV